MTWPNWNWELIEALGIVIGGLVLFLSVNRWTAKRGMGIRQRYTMANNWRASDEASLFRYDVSQTYHTQSSTAGNWRSSDDIFITGSETHASGFRTNPATGLPVFGGYDVAGNTDGFNNGSYRN